LGLPREIDGQLGIPTGGRRIYPGANEKEENGLRDLGGFSPNQNRFHVKVEKGRDKEQPEGEVDTVWAGKKIEKKGEPLETAMDGYYRERKRLALISLVLQNKPQGRGIRQRVRVKLQN